MKRWMLGVLCAALLTAAVCAVLPMFAPDGAQAAAYERMAAFMQAWREGDYEALLSCCLPAWQEAQEDPTRSIFVLLRNRTPEAWHIERIEGAGSAHVFAVKALMDLNNGRDQQWYGFEFKIVQEKGGFYADPAGLNSGVPAKAPATFMTPSPAVE